MLAGPATIGTAVGVDPGTWEEAAALALQWRRDGADIAGATGASYTPVAADDRTALSCRVTASNPAGSTSAETAPLPVDLRRARRRGGARRSRARPLDSGRASVAAAAAFTGAGLSYAVSGAGATIDAATGVVQPADRDAGLGRDGDGDRQQLRRQRRGELPAQRGGGGAGGGDGAEAHRQRQDRRRGQRRCRDLERQARAVTALQWRRDGADIAGATGGELHAGGGGRPDRAHLPGDREQPRGQCCGDDRGAAGDPGGAGGERDARGCRARPGRGGRQRGGGGRLHRRRAELCGLRGRGDDRRRDRGGQPADRGAGLGRDGDGDRQQLRRQRLGRRASGSAWWRWPSPRRPRSAASPT